MYRGWGTKSALLQCVPGSDLPSSSDSLDVARILAGQLDARSRAGALTEQPPNLLAQFPLADLLQLSECGCLTGARRTWPRFRG
jgi:hypothetical protein